MERRVIREKGGKEGQEWRGEGGKGASEKRQQKKESPATSKP